MQTGGQNQGGGHQSHDDRSGDQKDERRDLKNEHKADHHKNAQDKAKIWQKIEGAVAKDKINEFKQGFKAGQEGQAEAVFKKKRRRRRRKKSNLGTINQNLDQKFPQQNEVKKEEKPLEIKPVIKEAKEVVASPFDYDQSVQESGDVPSFDDDVNEEQPEEPIFSDEEVVKDEEVAKEEEVVSSEEVEPTLEKNIVPEIPENPEIPEVPVLENVPEVPEVPEVPDAKVVEEVPEAVASPIEPEEIAPNPPVAPINPFDFPSNNNVTPVNPFEDNHVEDYKEKKDEQPINPFDLSDPSSTVDDRREAEMTHSVPHINQGVNEVVESPEDVGESDEAKSVNFNDSSDSNVTEDENDAVDSKPEVIEVKASEVEERKIDPVFPDKLDQVVDVGVEAKESFWTILEHAGITKNKIIIFGVILVILIIGGLFFIFGGFNFGTSGGPKEAVKRTVVTQNEVKSDKRPYDVISSYIFGLEYQKQGGQIQAEPITSIGSMGGVDAGLIFGKIVNLKQERFVEYVQILEKMNNIYNVDLYSMLDLAVDRRATLDKYLKEMNNLIDQGDLALVTIQGDLQEYNTQYTATSKLANTYETAFFSQAKNYYGQTAYDNLQLFMDTSNQASRTKAQYGAENILKNMFINSLSVLKPRAKDISTNTEALIKGVKVFDIKGSDINAIIPVN